LLYFILYVNKHFEIKADVCWPVLGPNMYLKFVVYVFELEIIKVHVFVIWSLFESICKYD